MSEALEKLEYDIPELEVIVFGASDTNDKFGKNIRTHHLGLLSDETLMRAAYNACDLVVVPSRNESFGQVASEGMACGKPVVCFDVSGLKDIVDHKVNGYLASAYETSDLAHGISWVLNHKEPSSLSFAARRKVEKNFSEVTVSHQYLQKYKRAIAAASPN